MLVNVQVICSNTVNESFSAPYSGGAVGEELGGAAYRDKQERRFRHALYSHSYQHRWGHWDRVTCHHRRQSPRDRCILGGRGPGSSLAHSRQCHWTHQSHSDNLSHRQSKGLVLDLLYRPQTQNHEFLKPYTLLSGHNIMLSYYTNTNLTLTLIEMHTNSRASTKTAEYPELPSFVLYTSANLLMNFCAILPKVCRFS